jgi:hypothetical protein
MFTQKSPISFDRRKTSPPTMPFACLTASRASWNTRRRAGAAFTPLMTHISRFGIFLLASFFSSVLFVQAQDNYEIQVYGSDMVPPRSTMVEIHSNFTVSGSKPSSMECCRRITQSMKRSN